MISSYRETHCGIHVCEPWTDWVVSSYNYISWAVKYLIYLISLTMTNPNLSLLHCQQSCWFLCHHTVAFCFCLPFICLLLFRDNACVIIVVILQHQLIKRLFKSVIFIIIVFLFAGHTFWMCQSLMFIAVIIITTHDNLVLHGPVVCKTSWLFLELLWAWHAW